MRAPSCFKSPDEESAALAQNPASDMSYTEEGPALVKCCGNASGYKGVNGTAYPGRFCFSTKAANGRKKSKVGPFDTAEEAARELARTEGWGPMTVCDCWQCIRAAAPPAPAPLTETQVDARAKDEGLTIARTEEGTPGCGYKNIQHRRDRFAIQPKILRSLPASNTTVLHNSFATAQEAALALARLLGLDGSAAHAVVEEPLTEEQIAQCMKCTENGEAYDGIFGVGYHCELCFHDLNGKQCGKLYRSPGYATEGGRACAAGGWPEGERERVQLMHTEPVAKGDRGWEGRIFIREEDEGGSSSSEGGTGGYVHYCLHSDCNHRVAGFKQEGFDGAKMDKMMNKVYKHERDEHGDMPMTSEEVDDACCEQLSVWGTAVVHMPAKPLAESLAPPSTMLSVPPWAPLTVPDPLRAPLAVGSTSEARGAPCVRGRALMSRPRCLHTR